METPTNITEKLVAWTRGDVEAFNDVYPVVEVELRRLARSFVRRFRPGNTVQTTGLINEAYMRLASQNRVNLENRSHFFALAAKMMRRILLNYVRDRNRVKRGAGAIHVSLSEVAAVAEMKAEDLIDLDNALQTLEAFDPTKAWLVEMKYFGGMTNEEIAEAMNVSRASVVREWYVTRAWLLRELHRDGES